MSTIPLNFPSQARKFSRVASPCVKQRSLGNGGDTCSSLSTLLAVRPWFSSPKSDSSTSPAWNRSSASRRRRPQSAQKGQSPTGTAWIWKRASASTEHARSSDSSVNGRPGRSDICRQPDCCCRTFATGSRPAHHRSTAASCAMSGAGPNFSIQESPSAFLTRSTRAPDSPSRIGLLWSRLTNLRYLFLDQDEEL